MLKNRTIVKRENGGGITPRHDDFAADLLDKKEADPIMYEKLYNLIQKVYECHDVSDEEIAEVSFSVGFATDHVVKVFKWFFIEQDIRYWNYSGRAKTMQEVVPVP